MVKKTDLSEINAAHFTTSHIPGIHSSDQLKYTGFRLHSLFCIWLDLHGRFFQWKWKLYRDNCLFYWLPFSKAGQHSSCPYYWTNKLSPKTGESMNHNEIKGFYSRGWHAWSCSDAEKEDVLMTQKLGKKIIEITYKYSCCSSRTAELRSKGWRGRAELQEKILKNSHIVHLSYDKSRTAVQKNFHNFEYWEQILWAMICVFN